MRLISGIRKKKSMKTDAYTDMSMYTSIEKLSEAVFCSFLFYFLAIAVC